MNIKVKTRTIVMVVLVQVILVGGFFYWKKTAPVRKYKAEIKQLRMISEHQALEIQVTEQGKKLESYKKKPPVIDFNPPLAEPEAKRAN